ncbi:MAG TPA: YbfB/YjiJ family MFS transporter, partial [Dehalococcoidia bacterium]|nr:YbfB/YjiJ family MFS transporter [Dehalococcoidia bacterium]
MMAAGSRPFGLHYGYVALAAGAVALMATLGFGRWAYSLILPGMREGLTLTYTQMGILSTGNMVGYLAAVPVAGIAASRYGSRMVIGASMLVAGVALL